jgi:hypothetical protein
MSRLTRILAAGAVVAAMSLATPAAIAQTHTHHMDPTTQQEPARQGNDSDPSTQGAPGEREAEGRADATEPTAQTTAAPPDGPIGEIGWLVVSLGLLAVFVAGLAVLAARFSGGGPPIRHAT